MNQIYCIVEIKTKNALKCSCMPDIFKMLNQTNARQHQRKQKEGAYIVFDGTSYLPDNTQRRIEKNLYNSPFRFSFKTYSLSIVFTNSYSRI